MSGKTPAIGGIAMAEVTDVHTHFYPPAYLASLEERPGVARIDRIAGEADPVLAYEGDYNILVPGHRLLEARLEAMDEAGITRQFLSLTTPGVHVEEPRRGEDLARITNDGFAEAMSTHPKRFGAFAALPLQSPEKAARELERTVTDLGFAGGFLFSNVNGAYLDAPCFEPVLAAADDLGVPLVVHPTTPAQSRPFLDYRLVAMIGFLIDTSTTIARMIFAGIFDRHPGLQLVAGHLGGTLPYVQERLDRSWAVYPEVHDAIAHEPSFYLRNNVYYDTVNFDSQALGLARSFAGPGRIVLGSDYPHQIGDAPRSVKVIRSLDWPQDERDAVLGGNIARLLG